MEKSESFEKRRVFFLAVNTGYVDGTLPDGRCIEFYRARSARGLHCAIVGNVVLPGGSPSNSATSEISRAAIWSDLANAIRGAGAKPGIQLATAWPQYKGMTGFLHKKSDDPIRDYRRVIEEMSETQIEKVFELLNKGTLLAIDAGFEHIQLHAAHGYLFNLLLDERFYFGAKRAWELVSRWVKLVDDYGLESSVRISMLSGDKALDGSSNLTYMQGVMDAGPTYVDVSNGFYNVNKQLIYPNRSKVEERYALTRAIAAENPRQMFIASGLSSPLLWKNSAPNLHIGICRDLIANPNFLAQQDQGCLLCMDCHYYSLKRAQISCGQWS